MKKSILILFAAIALSACSDDTENLSVERTANDYQPNTSGSTWSYSSVFFDFEQKVTNGAKKIAGKTYFEVKVSIDGMSFNTYMRKDGINYINREVYKDQYDDGEYIYLKDAETGTTWTEITNNTEVEGEPVETIEVLKILEIDGTYEVNGTTFNDVIVVEVASQVAGSEGDPYIIFNYYAKGVGLIKVEDNKGEFVSTQLLEHSIKP